MMLNSVTETAAVTSFASTVVSWLTLGTKVVGGIVLTVLAILYTNQEKMLYMPNPPGFPRTPHENPAGYQSPATWGPNGRMLNPTAGVQGHIEFEEEFVKTEDGINLHTWLLLQPNSENTPTLIYFHGNAGNMGFLLKNAALMFAIAKVNILLMDYRGYGRSDGIPSESGINLDADAVLKYCIKHPRLTNSKMVLFGRSLGGAVAISLAQRYPSLVAGVIVENTFLSVGDMVDVLMPFLKHIRRFVLKMNWDSHIKIADLKMPIMFIAGDSDELVPPIQMRTLYNLAVCCTHREYFSVRGGTHNDTFEVAGIDYYHRLRAFIKEFVERTGHSAVGNTDRVVAPERVERAGSTGSGSGSSTEEEYLFVDNDSNEHVALPTMTTNFQVK